MLQTMALLIRSILIWNLLLFRLKRFWITTISTLWHGNKHRYSFNCVACLKLVAYTFRILAHWVRTVHTDIERYTQFAWNLIKSQFSKWKVFNSGWSFFVSSVASFALFFIYLLVLCQPHLCVHDTNNTQSQTLERI